MRNHISVQPAFSVLRNSAALLLFSLLVGLPIRAAAAVEIEWAIVNHPNNAADTDVMVCCGNYVGTSGYGAVPYFYRISKYETTNAQYAEFLNAVAATDTHALYNTNMGDSNSPNRGGITRSGQSGSFTYSAIAGRENMPVKRIGCTTHSRPGRKTKRRQRTVRTRSPPRALRTIRSCVTAEPRSSSPAKTNGTRRRTSRGGSIASTTTRHPGMSQ